MISPLTLVAALTLSPFPGTPAETVPLTTQNQVRVAANPNGGFIAVWNDFPEGSTTVRAAAVDATGTPTSEGGTYAGDLVSTWIASGPADHLFLRATATDLIATRVAPDGTFLQDLVLGRAMDLRGATEAVWTGSGYLVVAQTVWPMRFATFYLAPGVAGPVVGEILSPPIPAGWGRILGPPRLAFDGETVLLVWSDLSQFVCGFPGDCGGPRETGLMARRLSPHGVPIDETSTKVDDANDQALLVAGNGEFLLYAPGTSRAWILDARGSSLTVSAPKTVDTGMYRIADLAWSGREYVALTTALGRYAGIARLDRNANVTSSVIAKHIGWSDSHRIAARGDDLLLASVRRRVNQPSRVQFVRAAELRPLPPPPGPVSSRTESLGAVTQLSWQPAPDADGYQIEVWSVGGLLTHVGWLDGDLTSHLIPYPADGHAFTVRPYNAGGVAGDLPRRRSVRP